MAQVRSYAPFAKTRWTLIRVLGGKSGPARDAASEQLAQQYLSPVYSYVRSKGYSRAEASDIAQSFFADVVYERHLFERANQRRGRVRSLLKIAVDRHIIDLGRSQSNHRRYEVPASVLEAQEGHFLELQGESPDDVFEKSWAAEVVREAARRCWEQLSQAGQEESFELFVRWFGDQMGGAPVVPKDSATLAAELGLKRVDQVYSRKRRVRLRLQEAIREVLREQVGSGESLDEELQQFTKILGSPS